MKTYSGLRRTLYILSYVINRNTFLNVGLNACSFFIVYI